MQIFLAGEYYRNMGNAIKQIVWGGIVPDADILSKSSYNTEIPKRNTNGDYPIRGGYV